MRKKPRIYCFDLEGVFVPEIWIEVAKRFRMPSLRLTTRDIPDYDKLMRTRIGILKKAGIRLRDIQKIIAGIRPLPGAKGFLDRLRRESPVIILSDTFYEFSGPLMKKLGNPILFCNSLKVDKGGFISGYTLRIREGKKRAVQSLRRLQFEVFAAGDSYNDLSMLRAAHHSVLFNPPPKIRKAQAGIPAVKTYSQLLKILNPSAR